MTAQTAAPERRILALLITGIALVSLRLQYDAMPASLDLLSTPDRLWRLAAFFTVLTNLAVAAGMALVALGRPLSGSRATGLTLSITMVGIVYHLLLARLWTPQGPGWWADQGLHSAVPLLTLLWWSLFADRDIRPRDLPWWLLWPLTYCAYALIRGTLTGFWPYPFLDMGTLGPTQVALNIAGLIAAFAAVGAGLLAVAKAPRGRAS